MIDREPRFPTAGQAIWQQARSLNHEDRRRARELIRLAQKEIHPSGLKGLARVARSRLSDLVRPRNDRGPSAS